jgi:hypothetical protein
MSDSVVFQVDYFDVLQIHEDFFLKFLDLVVEEVQCLQILQIPKHVFGQIIDFVAAQNQKLKFVKMFEVCAFDEFDLLKAQKKLLQVFESFTDSSEDVIERSKVKDQIRTRVRQTRVSPGYLPGTMENYPGYYPGSNRVPVFKIEILYLTIFMGFFLYLL